MSADVADDDPYRPVGQLDPVVEISAQERAVAAGLVSGGPPQLSCGDQGSGQQPPLERSVLRAQELRFIEPMQRLRSSPASNGVAHRPGQALSVHVSLD